MSALKVTCTTSACPVSPVHTCLYVGLGTEPPAYPETTSSTPSRSSKTASRHQKHPPASVATSLRICLCALLSYSYAPCYLILVDRLEDDDGNTQGRTG